VRIAHPSLPIATEAAINGRRLFLLFSMPYIDQPGPVAEIYQAFPGAVTEARAVTIPGKRADDAFSRPVKQACYLPSLSQAIYTARISLKP